MSVHNPAPENGMNAIRNLHHAVGLGRAFESGLANHPVPMALPHVPLRGRHSLLHFTPHYEELKRIESKGIHES